MADLKVMSATPEPHYGFTDSRRLTGPNRYFHGPAATLTPLGAAAADPAALNAWGARVRAVAAARELVGFCSAIAQIE